MKIPDDTPVELSMGIWRLFGVGELSGRSRPELPLDAAGMELLRRHREVAEERGPIPPDFELRLRFGGSGQIFVVFVCTMWWREPRENSPSFFADTIRFVPTTSKGPGLLTLMCLEEEWEALVGERPDKKPWPREN